jgi:hypothetical protein
MGWSGRGKWEVRIEIRYDRTKSPRWIGAGKRGNSSGSGGTSRRKKWGEDDGVEGFEGRGREKKGAITGGAVGC